MGLSLPPRALLLEVGTKGVYLGAQRLLLEAHTGKEPMTLHSPILPQQRERVGEHLHGIQVQEPRPHPPPRPG